MSRTAQRKSTEALACRLDYLITETVKVDKRRTYHARQAKRLGDRIRQLDADVMAVRRELANSLPDAEWSGPVNELKAG